MPRRQIIRSTRPFAKDPLRVGVDTGGTFTDFIYWSNAGWRLFKLASTPGDPSQAILKGLEQIQAETGQPIGSMEIVHGTTVGTNALLQRRGAKVALITTAGFEDVLEIGRQARPSLYDLNAERAAPLVPSERRFGIVGRVDPEGILVDEFDEAALGRIKERIRRSGADAVAISLLFAFVEPEFEKRIARALRGLKLPLSISHEILPEYREYERTSTVVINAYLQPLMGTYLRQLQRKAPRLRVMQSSGGSISAAASAREPVRTILSGPAGGVVGALRAARASGFDRIMTFDMGGTSTDVALCDRDGLRMTRESVVSGMPVAIPMMDIHTVGAGGGSLARVDEGGSLRVGPESAGADPGPACYGRGTLPTVTDAHLVLGHFGGAGLLGGGWELDEGRARAAFADLAAAMGRASRKPVSMETTAQGVVSVVRAGMERALRVISVERGYDPRDFALVSFGGAGGLHAVELARALRMPRVIVPAAPGALSALGCLAADVIKDRSQTVMLTVSLDTAPRLKAIFAEAERTATKELKREGFPPARQRHERILAMRYQGQSFELDLPWSGGKNIAEAFHAAHRARYGYAQEGNPIEIVSARVRSAGLIREAEARATTANPNASTATPAEYRSVSFGARPVRTAVYRREKLPAGARLVSPCIVTEYSGTTLIPAGTRGQIDSADNLVIET